MLEFDFNELGKKKKKKPKQMISSWAGMQLLLGWKVIVC